MVCSLDRTSSLHDRDEVVRALRAAAAALEVCSLLDCKRHMVDVAVNLQDLKSLANDLEVVPNDRLLGWRRGALKGGAAILLLFQLLSTNPQWSTRTQRA